MVRLSLEQQQGRAVWAGVGEGRVSRPRLAWLIWPQRRVAVMTVWPSGLRRWLQVPVRKGVGSNPTAVTMPTTTTAPPTPFACARIQQTTRTRCSCGGRGRAGLPLPLARARPLLPCAESQRLRIEASGARAAAKSSSPLAQSAKRKALNLVVVGPSPTMGVCGVRACSRCCAVRADASSAHCN